MGSFLSSVKLLRMKRLVLILLSICFIKLSQAQFNDMPAFGTDSTLDVVSWNIEWFPKDGQNTLEYVSELIEIIDADIYALQEISDTNQFKQMLSHMDSYSYYMRSDWYGGLAYLYKNTIISIDTAYEIYTEAEYWRPFPRSPLVLEFSLGSDEYVMINNHLKCCGDEIRDPYDPWDEETRRFDASVLLESYINTNFQDKKVILLGDLNDELLDKPVDNVFYAFFKDADSYLFTDLPIEEGDSSAWSYPSWPSHLDHILINDHLFDDFAETNARVETIKPDQYLQGGWGTYDARISDHRPVGVRLATEVHLSIKPYTLPSATIVVSPNPVSKKARISFDPAQENGTLKVFNMEGELIQSWEISTSQSSIQWKNIELTSGIYILILQINHEFLGAQKVLIQ